MTTSTSFYVTGGTLPGDAPSYILRRADQELLDGLRRSQFCYVLTSRQMGKSSLMVRTAARLRQEGVTSVVLDLTAVGQNTSEAQWYDGLLNLVARQLDIEEELDVFWATHPRLGPQQRWMMALEEVALKACTGRLVVFIDEIDTVRTLPFSADGFFAGIRECYNRRSQDRVVAGLTFCLLGVASPSDLIRDTRATPFNIGRRIELSDFTPEEAVPLEAGLRAAYIGPSSRSALPTAEAPMRRILYWTGGHPYLTQRLCQAVAEALGPSVGAAPAVAPTPALVDRLCTTLFFSDTVRHRDDNLLFVRERLLRSDVDRAGLLDLYRTVRSGKWIKYDETNALMDVLSLSGIVRLERGYLRVRNRIYAHVFDKAWVETYMPEAELRRQQAAYRRGMLRAVTLSSIMIGSLAALLTIAIVKTRYAQHLAKDLKSALKKAQDNAGSANAAAAVATAFAHQRDAALKEALAKTRLAQRSVKAEQRATKAARTAELHAKKVAAYGLSQAKLANKSAADAMRQRDEVQHLYYIANMNLIAERYADNDFKRVQELLEQTKDSPYRGFEWGYWKRLCHVDLVTLTGHSDVVTSAAYSPAGRQIVTSSFDKTAKIWDASTGQTILTLIGHSDTVFSAVFSPDGTQIATGSSDHSAKVWDANNGRMILTLTGHSARVNSVAFSPDGTRIVTASVDRTARVWDSKTGRNTLTLNVTGINLNKPLTAVVQSAAFSPDGMRIVTASLDGSAKIWDAITGREMLTCKESSVPIFSAVFSPDGTKILTANADSTARVWDVATGRNLLTLKGHSGALWSVAFSPNGKRIVTAGDDRSARVWDASTGSILLTLTGHSAPLRSAAFSPDGKRIVTACADKSARVWEATTDRTARTLSLSSSPYCGLRASSRDGNQIVIYDTSLVSGKIM